MTPVPYPKNTGAYPTAKPQPLAASSVTQPKAFAQTPPVTVEGEQTALKKVFELKPTANSIYVSSASQKQVDVLEVETSVSDAEGQAVDDSAADFEISASLTPEPQTNSIVLEAVPDALLSGEIITQTGEVLVTGSIELPPITGELAVISESAEADREDETDSASLNLTTVAPVRAPAVLNSKAAIGNIPSKHRRTSGQLMAMLTLAVLIVTVGSLYIMAAVLGVV